MRLFKKTKKPKKSIEKIASADDFTSKKSIDKNAQQQTFTFTEKPDKQRHKPTSGTKQGLSINYAEITPDQIKVLKVCEQISSAIELAEILKRTNKSKFKNDILNPLLDFGFFEQTIAEKPKSPKQKYRFSGVFVKKRLIS